MFLYSDEASISVVPVLSRTYAPKGQRPSITISTEISARLYMASAVSPQGDLFYLIRNTPFDRGAIIEYLEYLRTTSGRKLLIVWDGASIHHSELIKNWLAKQAQDDFFLAKQPHYSPELNADEQVWSHLKSCKLKNMCNQDVKELKPRIERAINQIRDNKDLIMAFFWHPELGYY